MGGLRVPRRRSARHLITDVALERKRHRLPPSATDVRLDGDEVVPDADDGDAGHFSRTFITLSIRAPRTKDSHECRDLENAQRRGGP